MRSARPALRLLVLPLMFIMSAAAFAVEPDEVLSDPALEARARALSAELRCVVCQNQSIDDSNAPLARDLRILLRERLVAGERPLGVTLVLPEVVEPAPPPDVTRGFAPAQRTAEAAGFSHHRAMHLDVRLQLAFMSPAVHQVPDPPTPFIDGIHGLMTRMAKRSPECR